MSNVVSSFQELFSAREIAIIFWVVVLFIWASWKANLLSSFIDLLKHLLHWRIASVLLTMGAYLVGITYMLKMVGLWTISASSVKELVYWYFGVGFVTLLNFDKAKEPGFFKKEFWGAISVTAAIQIVTDTYTFPLIIELFLVPFLFFLGAIIAYAGTDEKYKSVEKWLNRLLITTGIGMLWYSGVAFLENYANFGMVDLALDFVVPAIFALAFMPFIYAFAIVSSYEDIFNRLTWASKQASNKTIRHAKWRIFKVFGLNLFKLSVWSQNKWLRVHTIEDIDRLIAQGDTRTKTTLPVN